MRQDPARLTELRQHLILDTPAEQGYDQIVQQLAASLDVPIVMVNLLDADRDWFKSRIGVPSDESPASSSFCERFFCTDQDLVVVEDTTADPLFSTSPFVLGQPFIRFYAGARLHSNGATLGTLCAYDMRPRKISTAQVRDLQSLAGAAMELLSQRRKAGP